MGFFAIRPFLLVEESQHLCALIRLFQADKITFATEVNNVILLYFYGENGMF